MAKTLNKAVSPEETRLALVTVLAENSFDSVLVTDASAKGKIIFANKAFLKLTGYTPSEVIGKTPRILQGKGTDNMASLKGKQSITRKMERHSLCSGAFSRSKWTAT